MHRLSIVAALFFGLAAAGCGEPRYDAYKPVSANLLHEMVDRSQQDSVAVWYYDGSDEHWHYFNRTYMPLSFFQALFYASAFRVPREEMEMPKPFPRNDIPRTARESRPVFLEPFSSTETSVGPHPWPFRYDFNSRDRR